MKSLSNPIKIMAPQNEHSRHHVGLGMDVGTPDLHFSIRVDGTLYMFFLELKTKTGKLTKSQRDWARDYHENFASSNTHYAVAYGLKQACEEFMCWIDSLPRTVFLKQT